MAAASFTAAKFLAPVAARSGGERAPPLPAGASSSSFARTLRRGGAHHPRLRTALAVSSDLLAGNKAAQAAATHPVRSSALCYYFRKKNTILGADGVLKPDLGRSSQFNCAAGLDLGPAPVKF